ncbi:MAG: GGDEF domain-containing protein [Oligoflexia bacterium]|nr:GGDEF domain-containing protein [Oligoflexia bacterium]
MSSDEKMDKTNVVDSDTLKVRISEAQSRPPALVLLSGPAGIMGKSWLLDKNVLTVGREATCDIHVEEKSISKKHAHLKVHSNGAVSITDLQSTNGTEIATKKLTPHQDIVLRDNDQIKMGNVIFKFLSKGNIENVTAPQLFDQKTLDGLTQVLNKQSLLSHLDEAFKKSKLTETNLSVIVFDLDHFKKINDTLGHQAGDYVLRELASVVKNQLIRSADYFGRYGGEEFVVVLQSSPLQRACEVAERIRTTIEKHQFKFESKNIPVTVSLGVACIEPTMTDSAQLFAKADQAAYRSKSAGRNRVSSL